MILTNAHLISPDLDLPDASVRVENGEITEVGHLEVRESEHVVDLGGDMLLPGFIDIHSHGANGADVCDACSEKLETIAQSKLREGVTTWLPTTLTQPQDRLLKIVQTVRDWAPSAPLNIPGIHLEGPFINREQAGAQNPEFVREPNLNEFRQLHEIFPALILSLAPEMPGSLDLIREATGMGTICSAAHTKSNYETLMISQGYGLKNLTHFGNAMTGLHHREIGVVGAGLLETCFNLELIADGIHLSPEMLELIFAKVPLQKLMLITDSVSASWQPDGKTTLGGLNVEIKNGIARLSDEGKEGTLAGSTLQFPQGFRRIHKITEQPLAELVCTTSWNQAQMLKLPDLGKIAPGYRANLTVLDDAFEVKQTFVAGNPTI